MGNWTLVITGIGAHHNNKSPGDADVLAEQAMKLFRDKGHGSLVGLLTYGGTQEIYGLNIMGGDLDPSPKPIA